VYRVIDLTGQIRAMRGESAFDKQSIMKEQEKKKASSKSRERK